LDGIDDVQGSMGLSGTLYLRWRDARLSWDPFLTHGHGYRTEDDGELIYRIFIPAAWIWMPDIELFNQIDNVVIGDSVEVYYDGTIIWKPTFTSTSVCDLDLAKFPFDSQICKLQFLSPKYRVNNGIKFANKGTGYFVLDGASAVSWKLSGTQSAGNVHTQFVERSLSKKSVLQFSFEYTRYTAYYWSTAIIPLIAIVVVAIAALWLHDYPTRLAFAVTAMLTVIAIGWSISSSIPISKSQTWIERLSMASTEFIAMVCIQSIISAVVAGIETECPEWLKTLLGYYDIFHLNAYDLCVRCVRPDQKGTGSPDIEGGSSVISPIVIITKPAEMEMMKVTTSHEYEDEAVFIGVDPASKGGAGAKTLKTEKRTNDNKIYILIKDTDKEDDLTEYEKKKIQKNEEKLFNNELWVEIAKAFDRFSLVIFIIVYFSILCSYFSDTD
jgi:hypothetical protein